MKSFKQNKILWLDLNSSYSHSSLALPAIHAQFPDDGGWVWSVVSATVNENIGDVVLKVCEEAPDVIAATCWLFTKDFLLSVLVRCNALLPDTAVVLGGPEFLGPNEEFLRENRFVTCVFRGEGEEAFPAWLSVRDDVAKWREIKGLCYIEDGICHDNGRATVRDFASLNPPHQSRFFNWSKPFVQLETTRGCFNTCAFCVSGGEKPVRELSLEEARKRLEVIHSHGIRDVRMLDRTFNYDNVRALAMLDMFCDFHPDMRFHLEVHPALLSATLKEKLRTLPQGLLHIEAGIQSLHEDVLKRSGRAGSLKASLEGLRFLVSCKNLIVHADLIAGLPLYTIGQIFEDVLSLAEIGTGEIQLESLKVLPGTEMRRRAGELCLKYSPYPPYEVLESDAMSLNDLRKAMYLSRMLDMYYNVPAWQGVFRRILLAGGTAFMEHFIGFLVDGALISSPLSQERRGLVLFRYCRLHMPDFLDELSRTWIEAGLSLKKEPAEKVVKIKDCKRFMQEHGYESLPEPEFGSMSDSLRLFWLPQGDGGCLYGFDSENHSPYPVYKAVFQEMSETV